MMYESNYLMLIPLTNAANIGMKNEKMIGYKPNNVSSKTGINASGHTMLALIKIKERVLQMEIVP